MSGAYCVVIPAHNEERFIGEALASVSAQTVPASEIVVIDDGSTDNTAEIARAHGAHVISQSPACGPSASRNRAIAATTSPFIAFLDADDAWLPGHVSQLLGAMASPRVVFAGSRVEAFGTQSGALPAPFETDCQQDIRDFLIRENPVIQSTAIVRRTAFLQSGGYDESLRLSEDYDLWMRLAELGDFAFCNTVTARRRMHEGQATNRFRGELIRAWWGVRARALKRRLDSADAQERERVLSLLTTAAIEDVELAIWTGKTSMLDLVRDELSKVDTALSLRGRLDHVGGVGAPLTRATQDLRCRFRAARRKIGASA